MDKEIGRYIYNAVSVICVTALAITFENIWLILLIFLFYAAKT